jgi:hypothetical protein
VVFCENIGKKRLTQSGPLLRSNRENYYIQWLADNTSNDLKYILNRNRMVNNNNNNEFMGYEELSREYKEIERLFLCKSSPLVMVM